MLKGNARSLNKLIRMHFLNYILNYMLHIVVPIACHLPSTLLKRGYIELGVLNSLALTGSWPRKRKIVIQKPGKTKLDSLVKAVGPRIGKLRFQTTRCYVEVSTTGLSSRAGRAL